MARQLLCGYVKLTFAVKQELIGRLNHRVTQDLPLTLIGRQNESFFFEVVKGPAADAMDAL
jgi:hypothetical protein